MTEPARFDWPAAFNVVPKWAIEREDVFQMETERIFEGPVWHLIAHVSELHEPGRFKTAFLGRTPLLIVHTSNGELRALHNTCAHRGTMVEPRFRGASHRFECPFHRWCYDLDGSLLRCPGESEFPESFSRKDNGLKQARLDTFCGLIFVTLNDQAPPLKQWLDGIEKPLRAAMGNDGRLQLLGYQKVVFEANWKIYIDDEGYHAPLLHKAFQILRWTGGSGSQTRTPQGHRITETTSSGEVGGSSLLRDPGLIEYAGGDHPRNKYSGQCAGSLLVTPWPLGAIMNHLDIINIRFANPLDASRTEVHYAYFSHQDDDQDMVQHRIRQSSNLIGPSGFISLEDGAVFARIQRGIHGKPDETRYIRGWRDSPDNDPYAVSQNDETTNTVWWDAYRRTMGFNRVQP